MKENYERIVQIINTIGKVAKKFGLGDIEMFYFDGIDEMYFILAIFREKGRRKIPKILSFIIDEKNNEYYPVDPVMKQFRSPIQVDEELAKQLKLKLLDKEELLFRFFKIFYERTTWNYRDFVNAYKKVFIESKGK